MFKIGKQNKPILFKVTEFRTVELMNPPPQPIVSEFNWSVLTVAVLHTAVCPRDRAEMGVSV